MLAQNETRELDLQPPQRIKPKARQLPPLESTSAVEGNTAEASEPTDYEQRNLLKLKEMQEAR